MTRVMVHQLPHTTPRIDTDERERRRIDTRRNVIRKPVLIRMETSRHRCLNQSEQQVSKVTNSD